MPQIIEYIDEIAKRKGRDVLYLGINSPDSPFGHYIKNSKIRRQILKWLDEHQIGYVDCICITHRGLLEGYLGHVYLDIAYDESDPKYQQLAEFLENPDGTMKFKGVKFLIYTLRGRTADR